MIPEQFNRITDFCVHLVWLDEDEGSRIVADPFSGNLVILKWPTVLVSVKGMGTAF